MDAVASALTFPFFAVWGLGSVFLCECLFCVSTPHEESQWWEESHRAISPSAVHHININTSWIKKKKKKNVMHKCTYI